ncbi:MAG TPA: hypothetical protein ENG87_00570 [Candidatus Pacearchaeota archaeon]|nr:hypothetical protein BMS3Abin17_00964 [archaeon BMS3Abin17]HDK41842.1 hypothetical protein [Candidatus Pacearchaeota archaeon]HDZ60339.1 hypothetical protein [Candidatus Pacearchaeota archaeon]
MENKNQTHKMKGGRKTNTELYIQLAIIGILAILIVYNTGKIYESGGVTGAGIGIVSASEITPTGVPAIYGKELGVNFDEVSPNNPGGADANIGILKNLDKTLTLQGSDLQRYIDITSQISCEYCCGAKSVIRSDGSAACGCAHSYAIRGLAKYLIKEHGSEYTDDEILSELGKWRVLFFPGVHEQKATALKSQGIEINYINLASNAYRGIEKGQTSGGGMVGGC